MFQTLFQYTQNHSNTAVGLGWSRDRGVIRHEAAVSWGSWGLQSCCRAKTVRHFWSSHLSCERVWSEFLQHKAFMTGVWCSKHRRILTSTNVLVKWECAERGNYCLFVSFLSFSFSWKHTSYGVLTSRKWKTKINSETANCVKAWIFKESKSSFY